MAAGAVADWWLVVGLKRNWVKLVGQYPQPLEGRLGAWGHRTLGMTFV